MSSIYIVGGEDHSKLKSYLETRGSLSIIGSVDSLSKSKAEIQSSIIKADKMIYLYTDESLNIREEMNILRGLLTGDGFFRVDEIIFFIVSSDITKKGTSYIKNINEQISEDVGNCPTFTIKSFQNTFSYEEIYSEILGLGDFGSQYENSEVTVYRVARGSDVKHVYEGADNRDMSVEPFDLSAIQIYNSTKNLIAMTESATNITESPQGIKKYDNPIVGSYSLSTVFGSLKCILVCGNRYSGKSTTASALAASLQTCGNKVLAVDLTGQNDIEKCLDFNNIDFESIGFSDFIGQGIYNDISSVNVYHINSVDITMETLAYISYNIFTTGFDALIVEANLNIIDLIYRMLEDILATIIYLTPRMVDTVSDIQTLEQKININSICLITSSINSNGFKQTLSNEEITERLVSRIALAESPLLVESNSILADSIYGGRI